MVQISWLWGLDKINPERVGAANDGGKSRGQPENIGDSCAVSGPCLAAGTFRMVQGQGAAALVALPRTLLPPRHLLTWPPRPVSRPWRVNSSCQHRQDLLLQRLVQWRQGQGLDRAHYLLRAAGADQGAAHHGLAKHPLQCQL